MGWQSNTTICPECKKPTIDLIHLKPDDPATVLETFRAYSTNTFRPPTPKEAPAHIKEDYEEACRVLSISQKASAALSRRCLQAILQGQGYTQRDLAVQIEALLNESDSTKAIPTALRQTVDAIRKFGNFSAHPITDQTITDQTITDQTITDQTITDQTTLQIIAVESHEAEWCLEKLENMFDHYYVKPAQAKARKAALDAKLAAAKNPPSK
jgi:Domain of unknown function (DUF4145)